ncbi:MAG: glycosyltransferase family 4 protein [Candidatus Nanohaloarchaea archaeon]
MSEKTAFIGFNKLHPCHKGFAEAIDADIIEMDEFSESKFRHFRNGILYLYYALKLRKYDSVICEGTLSMRSGYLAKKLFGTKFLRLVADQDYIYLRDGKIESDLLVKMSKELDGAIAVSQLAKESAEPIIDAPIEIAYPYISDKMRGLIDEKGDLEKEKIILSVGYNRPNKGFDRLVEAFNEIKDEYDHRLVIVGKGNPEKFGNVERVETPGFVSYEKLAEYYMKAEIYVQPSYGDTFPVTVLEALYADTPCIVSDKTGEKEILPDENVFRDKKDLKEILEESIGSIRYNEDIELNRFFESKSKKRFKDRFNSLIT